MKLSHAQISFNESGTPVADTFTDVYFCDARGCEETDYVFIEQSQLLTRWSEFTQSYPNMPFVIGETGFGTGLNFFQTCHHYQRMLDEGYTLPRLYYLSTEKFPVTPADITKALAVYPHLAPFIDELLPQYPMPLAGCHRMSILNDHITLDLWLGDIHDILPQWHVPPNEKHGSGLIDAWYLDGFAPSKNPDMWNDALFAQLARLTKPTGTIATFTAAGFVRRALNAAGFTTKKAKGFGKKREMLSARLTELASREHIVQTHTVPYYQRSAQQTSQTPITQVSILGGGIATGCLAYLLTQQGIKVNVYCADSDVAQGASGNDLGGFYPQLNAQASHASQVHASSFVHAKRFYDKLIAQGANFEHDWCGVLLVGFNDKVKTRQHALQDGQTWPDALIKGVSVEEAEAIAGVAMPYTGLFISDGGWISPPQLVKALLQLSTQTGLCQIETRTTLTPEQIDTLTQSPEHAVIYATGASSPNLPIPPLPYRVVRGQVESASATVPSTPLNTVLCHKGYFTPAINGYHAMGSTYVKEDTSCDYRASESEQNLAMHQQSLVECPWIQAMTLPTKGRAAVRCSTPDHLPLVGAVPDIPQQLNDYAHLYQAKPAYTYPDAQNIPQQYILTGLGSRGLTTAPLMAELLVSQLLGHPLPVSRTISEALCPNRFLIRDGVRRQDYLARFMPQNDSQGA